jgi:hypothetical protein
MDEIQNNAPESEVIDQAEETVEETQQTIGELSEEIYNEESEEHASEKTVPEYAFVAQKKALIAAEKELKALRDSMQYQEATQYEQVTGVDAIADKYNIDREFMNELKSTIENDLDAKYASKESAKEKADKFNEAFNKQYNTALERGPEFQAIANPDVIKTLATLPQNKNKTVSQLLEETYGNALTGKRTIETTQPGGGKDPEPLDFAKAEKDINYFNEVMADPKKKAQYNDQMLKRGF